MDRARIHTATQILAKAASTGSDAEALALVEGCYRLLARLLNEHDSAPGEAGRAPGRTERRLRFDRRRWRARWFEPPRAVAVTSGAYRGEVRALPRGGPPGHVDVEA